MEENKVTENVSENKQQKEIKFSLSDRIFNSIFSIIALLVFAIEKILASFAVAVPVLYGIMSIIVVSLAIIGLLWNYIKCKKFNFEFGFCAGVAFLVLLV